MISTNRFTWDPEHRHFVGEISELSDIQMEQVWPDSADAGFKMISARTGEVRTVVHVETMKDDEGEIICSIFEPVRTDCPAVDVHAGWDVVIYND